MKYNVINKLKDSLSIIGTNEGNVARYRIIYVTCLVEHAFLAILFTAVSVTELAVFNIVSSTMYLIGLFAVKTDKYTKLWLFLMYAEIVSHGILTSFFIGYNYNFTQFSLAIIPVCYFMTYLDPAFKRPMVVSSLLAVINGAGMLIMLYRSIYYEPVYNTFPPQFVNSIAQMNQFIAIMILVTFSVMFIAKINVDMKVLREQNDKLDFLANYDQLTGLRNRNHIKEIFEQYIMSKEPYCVILGDIDDFKHVNDTYGHNAGDDVLRMVASVISGKVGNNGIVCRWGGEEILILLKGTPESCIKLNEEILSEIRATAVQSGAYRINITMTFGLCDYSDAKNIEKLISLADKRLYIGKNSGKNKVVTRS